MIIEVVCSHCHEKIQVEIMLGFVGWWYIDCPVCDYPVSFFIGNEVLQQ